MISILLVAAVQLYCGPQCQKDNGPPSQKVRKDIPGVHRLTCPGGTCKTIITPIVACYMPTSDLAQQSEMIAEMSRTCGRSMALTDGFAVKISRDKDGKLTGMECRQNNGVVGRANFCHDESGIIVLTK